MLGPRRASTSCVRRRVGLTRNRAPSASGVLASPGSLIRYGIVPEAPRRTPTSPIPRLSMSAPSRITAAPAPSRATYTISDLAREFALTTRAIRFYEDCGLLTPKREKRARVYGERERVRLKLILRGKRLGLALSEIGELLDLYEVRRNEKAQLTAFLALLADRRTRLLQQREDIEIVLAEIDGIERECRRRLRVEARGGAN
jgi:DNA-binding transcriptional MerR regulator